VNLRANIADREATPNLWSDAYLAAIALSTGLQMVTFDAGFRSFPSLNPLVLMTPAPAT
jgi:predicted nucleic acid-binding protein